MVRTMMETARDPREKKSLRTMERRGVRRGDAAAEMGEREICEEEDEDDEDEEEVDGSRMKR